MNLISNAYVVEQKVLDCVRVEPFDLNCEPYFLLGKSLSHKVIEPIGLLRSISLLGESFGLLELFLFHFLEFFCYPFLLVLLHQIFELRLLDLF